MQGGGEVERRGVHTLRWWDGGMSTRRGGDASRWRGGGVTSWRVGGCWADRVPEWLVGGVVLAAPPGMRVTHLGEFQPERQLVSVESPAAWPNWVNLLAGRGAKVTIDEVRVTNKRIAWSDRQLAVGGSRRGRGRCRYIDLDPDRQAPAVGAPALWHAAAGARLTPKVGHDAPGRRGPRPVRERNGCTREGRGK